MTNNKVLTIAALLCIACLQARAGEINLLTVDYAPYYGPDLDHGGPITEIVSQAFEQAGHQVSVRYVPWARALAEAKSGQADGLHGAWYAKEREEWFVYSDKLPGNEIVLYKRKGAKPENFSNYADLQQFKIGVVRDYVNPPEFDAANLRIEEANSDKLNLTKLARERVDLILIDRALANYILTNELPKFKDQLVAVEPPLKIEYLYILLSKKTADYQKKIDGFNEGLAAITKQGKVEDIMRKHHLR